MKKFITIALCAIGAMAQAQVTIEKTAPSAAPANASVSLELGNATGGAKGIILPYVADCTALPNPVAGTIVYDVKTQKVKYAAGATAGSTTVGSWVDLSNGASAPATPVTVLATSDVATKPQAIIGSRTGAPNGILVLNDTNKAMILPRVNAYTDIPNPSAGMMVYCTSTNTLAVYNGSQWSFWTQ